MGHHQLDSLDEQILRLIADNARIPFLEVARACNVSGAAIHQRIQKLTNLGSLKGSVSSGMICCIRRIAVNMIISTCSGSSNLHFTVP